MADITAKRGPIDPNKYNSNQGVATQAQLKGLDRDIRYHENQPSTWDNVVGGIKDVMNIAGSAMNLYNNYQDTFGNTDEEELALEEQKVARTKRSAANTQQASQLSKESIKAKLLKDKESKSLEFKKKIEGAVDANNEEDVVKYSLEDIRSAKDNKDLLESIASYYEWNGHQQSADLIRGAYSGQPEKVNLGSKDSSYSVANPEQYNKYISYKDNVGVLSSQLMSPINSGKLANLGLDVDDPEKLASELLTNCDLEITDTNDYNLDKNKFTSTINGTNNLSSVINSTAENSYQTPANNIQFLKISKKTPIGVRTETFTIDPSILTTVPYRDDNGVYTKDQETDYGTVVSKVVAQGLQYKEKAKKKYNVPELAPAITTESVNKEQAKRDTVVQDEVASEKIKSLSTDQKFLQIRDLMTNPNQGIRFANSLGIEPTNTNIKKAAEYITFINSKPNINELKDYVYSDKTLDDVVYDQFGGYRDAGEKFDQYIYSTEDSVDTYNNDDDLRTRNFNEDYLRTQGSYDYLDSSVNVPLDIRKAQRSARSTMAPSSESASSRKELAERLSVPYTSGVELGNNTPDKNIKYLTKKVVDNYVPSNYKESVRGNESLSRNIVLLSATASELGYTNNEIKDIIKLGLSSEKPLTIPQVLKKYDPKKYKALEKIGISDIPTLIGSALFGTPARIYDKLTGQQNDY